MSSYYEKMLATGEVKCIDEEVPFEIPATWNWARLSNITSILGDGIHGTPEYDATGTAYFINGNNLSNGSIEIKADTKKVSEQEAEKHKRLLNSTTVLVSINGTLGNVAFYNGENVILGKSACYFNLMGNIDKQYIKHILETEYFTEYAKNVATGSTIKNVPLAGMRNFLIPVPPITEQHRIILGMVRLAHSIVRYNDAQTKLDLLNNVLNEKLKKSVLQEAIQGKLVPQLAEEGTAQELLEQIKAEKEKLVKEGKLKKSALNNTVIFRGDDNKYWEKSTECMECIDDKIPFEIPSTWCWVRHNQLFEISGGSQPPKSQFVDNPKSGYIRLYQIRDYGSNPMPVYIPKEKANKITKEGDIILARYGGSLGKVFWAKDGAYNVAMAKVIPLFDSEFVNKQYLFLFYQSSIYQYLVKDHSRSAQAGFNKDDLTDLFFPLPPLEEQSRIVEKYKSVTSIMSR